MTDASIENNREVELATPPSPDAYGQAALLLSESMLHALIEGKVFSVADALDVVSTAAEVKEELAQDTHEARDVMLHSLRLLNAIAATLRHDI